MHITDLCKSRWELPNGELSPLLIPSFSSRGFPILSEAHKFLSPFMTDVSLISAFDIHNNYLNPEKIYGSDIPVIKLFKGAQSSFPKENCLSGYHIESLAINAFKDYKGGLNKKEMFKHFCEYVTKNVTKPVSDSTGQSIHVDDRPGPSNSIKRRKTAAPVSRLVDRLGAADAKHDANKWGDILNGE